MDHEKRGAEQPGRETGGRGEHSTRQSTRRRGRGRMVWKVIGTLFLVFILTCSMFAGIFMTYVNKTLIHQADVDPETLAQGLSSILYYQNRETGNWEELQMLESGKNRIEVELSQMPKDLQNAAIAIEDERFLSHHGVDWWRTGGAVVNMFFGMRNTFGGSTITQQLIKNLTGDKEGTVKRKVTEIVRALEFEKKYSKDEIMEMYLNNIFLGRNCYGVQTAAQTYFGKDVSQLSLAECASLIGITNNPWKYDPLRNEESRANNQSRKELVLEKMLELEFITQAQHDSAMAEQVAFVEKAESAEGDVVNGVKINSYFVDQLISEVADDLSVELGISTTAAVNRLYYGGYRVYTTLDPRIQGIAEAVYEDLSNINYTSKKGNQLQSAITIVDPSTGDVVAMVGGVGVKKENRGWNRAVAVRQCGSSIKPIASYAPALDKGVVTMASVLDNAPVRLLNNKPWPKNSGGAYTGLTTLARGVAGSINTIAVRVNEMLGNAESFKFLEENLGISTLVADDLNTAALGLGGLTNGVTTEEMAAAFAAFPNNGVYNHPRLYTKVTKVVNASGAEEVVLDNALDSQVAMKETTAYFMNQLLKGVVTGGTGGGARLSGMTVAGKTGTTSENYDRYFVGYTPYYCAAVWCGYDRNEKIVASVNPAAALWKKVMSQVHEGLSNKDFSKPSSGLVSVRVCLDSGMLATEACTHDIRGESRTQDVLVAAGTEPKEPCTMHKEVQYCPEGKCLAGEFCPEESVTTVAVLDYQREDFGVTVADTPYLLSTLEKAVEEGGCTVHTEAPVVLPPDDSGLVYPGDGSTTDPEDGLGGGGTGEGGGTGGDDWFQDPWGGLAPTPPTEPTEP